MDKGRTILAHVSKRLATLILLSGIAIFISLSFSSDKVCATAYVYRFILFLFATSLIRFTGISMRSVRLYRKRRT